MTYRGTPDYVLDGVVRLLGIALPLIERAPGAIADPALYNAYRARVAVMRRDPRAAARSLTLAEDLAAVLSSYRRAAGDPAAAFAGLERLAVAMRAAPLSAGDAGTARLQAEIEWALAGLIEWLAVAEAAQTLASMTITSYDHAAALRARFARLIGLAIERASDRGTVAVVRLLTHLSGAVARDLIERGRPLARLVAYETAIEVPAVVLAHKLYQDAGRAPDLMAENDSYDHPAFMPRVGRAMSR
jgi:prophage DNA circulation protein